MAGGSVIGGGMAGWSVGGLKAGKGQDGGV